MDMRLIQQAQQMQKQMEKKLAEFEQKKFEYDYKNGSVVITIGGNLNIFSIKIADVLIDPEDKSMLQDMVQEAINVAINGVKKSKDSITGMLGSMGGLF